MGKEPIIMTEECWSSSQFSLARHTGQISVNGVVYIIVNKEGKDIFECSHEAQRAGRDKAIEPGEPADLIDIKFIKYYKFLGRDKFIKICETHQELDKKEMHRVFKQAIKEAKS